MQKTISNTPGAGDTLRAGTDKINQNFTQVYSGNFAPEIVLPKASGSGIKVDQTTPTFGWKDLLGAIVPGERWRTDVPRVDVPDCAAFRGGIVRAFAFSVNDKIDQIAFHLPHDYAEGTDIFIHSHWSHNGTAISGTLVWDYFVTYAKGHNQAIYSPEIHLQQTILTPDIGTIPQYQHRLDEIPLSAQGGGVSLLDTALLEVDGLILVALYPSVIPTITGSANNNEPFLFHVDLHYQSTGLATKSKAPDFYA